MSIIEAIIIGIIQGATEFLPVSSSGHAVLLPELFGITNPTLTQVVVAHLGTLVAILIVFWRDLWAILVAFLQGIIKRAPFGTLDSRLGWFILVGSIPAAAAGFLLEDWFTEVFGNPTMAALFLLVTAGLLVLGERLRTGDKPLEKMGWTDAIVVGVFQMFALLPGLSRSGSTITGGLIRGLERDTATRYSFLLGAPIIFGAGMLGLLDLRDAPNLSAEIPILLTIFVTSALVGYVCIVFLLRWVRSHSLIPFAIYCVALSALYFVTLLV
jgi:undecaprenyl-diphosphatase